MSPVEVRLLLYVPLVAAAALAWHAVRAGARAHVALLVRVALLAAPPAWCLARDVHAGPAVGLAIAATAVLVGIPLVCLGAARLGSRAGRHGVYALATWVRASLLPLRPLRLEAARARVAAHLAAGRVADAERLVARTRARARTASAREAAGVMALELTLARGDDDATVDALRAAVDAGALPPAHHLALARRAGRRGDIAGALAQVRALAAREGAWSLGAWLLVMRLHLLAYAGRLADVERLVAHATPRLGGALPATLARAVATQRAGRPEDALALLTSTEATHAHTPAARAQIAQARALVQQAVAPGPADAAALDAEAAAALAEIASPSNSLVGAAGRRARVTWALVALLAAAFAWTHGAAASDDLWSVLGLGANVGFLVVAGEWWRPMTALLLHAGWLHFLTNAWGLYLFGAAIEARRGGAAVLAVFFWGGLAGNVASLLAPGFRVSVGASGGVLALVGATLVLLLRDRRAFPPAARRFHLRQLALLVALDAFIGYVEPQIDNVAHAGGLAGGALLMLALSAASRARRVVAVILAAVAAIGVCAAVAAQMAHRPFRLPEALPVAMRTVGGFALPVPRFLDDMARAAGAPEGLPDRIAAAYGLHVVAAIAPGAHPPTDLLDDMHRAWHLGWTLDPRPDAAALDRAGRSVRVYRAHRGGGERAWLVHAVVPASGASLLVVALAGDTDLAVYAPMLRRMLDGVVPPTP